MVPPNHPLLTGFSIIFTIHFGGLPPIFGNTHTGTVGISFFSALSQNHQNTEWKKTKTETHIALGYSYKCGVETSRYSIVVFLSEEPVI